MVRTIFILLILFQYNLTMIKCKKILAVFPYPSRSHYIVFLPLVQELARQGHAVTVITNDPAFKNVIAPLNLREIDVHDISYKNLKEAYSTMPIGKTSDLITQIDMGYKILIKIFEAQMSVKEIKDIIFENKQEFDLLLIEAWTRLALGLTHVFKIPAIQINSLNVLQYNFKAIGASTHPLIYPTVLNIKLYNLTRSERILELAYHWRIENLLSNLEQEENNMLKKIFGPNIPTISKLYNNIDMLFINTHPLWADNRPVPPNVIYIRGIHFKPRKEIPKDLKTYLDTSKNGVIYMSFGTNVQPSLLPPENIQLLVKVFSQLPYDVIWKWDEDTLPEKSKNIKISKWLPQSDLLYHPNIKLFITQGGLQSTDEAINAGVPLIGMPIMGDQCYNTEKYVYHKIGKQLHLSTLTEDKLKDAIETVINDKSYRENIIRLRTLMEDEPMPPLERAIWWTEYVIRNGGAKHFRAPAANMSWTEYYEIDLIFIVLSLILIVLATVSLVIYYLWKVTLEKYKAVIKIKYS